GEADADRDRHQGRRSPEGGPGRCRDPRVQAAGAVQGQGRALRRRDRRAQRDKEEIDESGIHGMSRRSFERTTSCRSTPQAGVRQMDDKRISRRRRAAKTRVRIERRNAVRLTVHRTNQHIYAQVVSADGTKVLATASTLEKDVRSTHPNGAKKE